MSDDETDGWAIGALLGFMLGGPAGGFIGALLGAAADEACQPSGALPRAHHGNSNNSTTRSQSYQHTRNANTGHQRPRSEAWADQVPTLPSALDNAFAMLGLRPGVTLEAVKRRYHELARRHHPDLYESAGTDPRLRVEAQDRFIQIREAYELINQYLAGRR